MLTLSRSVTRGALGKEPLPPVFASWDSRSIRFRRASMSMLFGESGSHKTRIALNALVNMRVPTLAFSTDSDQDTVASRLVAIATGTPTETTEAWLRTEPDKCAQALAQYDFIQWEFHPSPDLDDIWLSTYAYAERHGVWPQQIMIDIASDVGHEAGDEWATLRDLMRQMKVLARETEAHVLLVHHASDSKATKKPCPSKYDMHGKVSKLPEVIISCGTNDRGELFVAIVKNRHAKADPNADQPIQMQLNAATSVVGDHTALPYALRHRAWNEEESWA